MRKFSVVRLIIPVVLIVSALMTNAASAEVNVTFGVNVPLPRFVFPGPPAVALIPGTYAYAVPDVDIDILFYRGHWYRPHRDRWYRSVSHNGPWGHIGRERIPGVILGLPPDYRQVPPGHQRIPYGHLKENWKDWERHRYWDAHEYRHEQWERPREKRREYYREEKREHHREEKREHHREQGGGGHHHNGGGGR